MSYSKRPRARFDENHIVVLDIETISGEEMEDGGFPPWPTHTPVVASMLTADMGNDGRWAFCLESVSFPETEEALLRIEGKLCGRSLITFNGRGFDLPVLMLTAQKARVFEMVALSRAATEPRYWSAAHYDLADKVSGYGAARGASLERLCSALGIPVKMTSHGSEVGQLFDNGDTLSIKAYCETDVAATLLAFAYHRAMETGDAGYHASLTWQFARWADEQGRDHLAPYAELRDGQNLQRLSLLGQLDAALENAHHNAEWRARQAIDAEFGEITPY